MDDRQLKYCQIHYGLNADLRSSDVRKFISIRSAASRTYIYMALIPHSLTDQ